MAEKVEIPTDGLKEVVIRKGKAIEYDTPLNIQLAGTLKAPFQFIESKIAGNNVEDMGNQVPMNLTEEHKIYNPKRSHLIVNREKGQLVLVLNEKDPFTDRITGRLTLSPEWAEFHINDETLLNLNQVIKLVKRNKFKFADAAKHGEFLINLQSFNARVTTNLKHERSNSGNSLDMIEKVVAENKNAPEFKLNVPIYQGYPKKVFNVQTCLEASSTSINFFFESVDLYELIDSEKEKAINEQIELFKTHFPCSIVEEG